MMSAKTFKPNVLVGLALLLLAAGGFLLKSKQKVLKGRESSASVHAIEDQKAGEEVSSRPKVPDGVDASSLSAISSLLEQLPSSEVRSRLSHLNKIGREMRVAVGKNPAHFEKCFEMVEGLAVNDRHHLIRSWLLGAKSPAGGIVDFEKKCEGITRLGLESDAVLSVALFFEAGKNKPEEILPLADKLKISRQNIEVVFAGALNDSGVSRTAELFSSLPDDTTKVEVFQKVGPHLFAKDSAATAKFVENVADQNLRKSYTTALVAWLRSKGDVKSAEEWENKGY